MLKYISKDVLIKILKQATSVSGKEFIDCVRTNLNQFEPKIIFWEKIKGYGEPDLIIKFSHKSGKELILCIEVKYYGSKSGVGEDDQLRKYFEGMSIFSSKKQSEFLGLIYLTKDSSKEELMESLECMKSKNLNNPESKLFQLRWSDMTKTIKEYPTNLSTLEKEIMQDLFNYLKFKNLIQFSKFSYQSEKFRLVREPTYKEGRKIFRGFTFNNLEFEEKYNKKIFYG